MSYVFGKPLNEHAKDQFILLGERLRKVFTSCKRKQSVEDGSSDISELSTTIELPRIHATSRSFQFRSAFDENLSQGGRAAATGSTESGGAEVTVRVPDVHSSSASQAV
jgi:hypothetical protein